MVHRLEEHDARRVPRHRPGRDHGARLRRHGTAGGHRGDDRALPEGRGDRLPPDGAGKVEEARGRVLSTRGWLYDAEGSVVAEATARFLAAARTPRPEES